ncbi:MAG: hypothetical protein ACLP01_28975 [Solirubrobacteraceae bacterium]
MKPRPSPCLLSHRYSLPLAALIDGPLHGYAITQRARELAGGRVRLILTVAARRPWITRHSAKD